MSLQGTVERPLTRTQKAIAAGAADPTLRTQRDVAKRAGVHEVSVSRALDNAKVQREIARIQAEKGDTARSLRKQSLSRAVANLHRVDDPLTLTQIAHHASGVEANVGAEDGGNTVEDWHRLRGGRMVLNAHRHGLINALNLPPDAARDLLARVNATLEQIDADIASAAIRSGRA